MQAKSILERTKVSVTNNAAKVMVLSIYDKKPFFMVTSQHVKVEARIVKRRRWNAEVRKPELVDKEVLVIVDDYNHRMCFVDDSDRLAWHYSADGKVWRERKFWTPIWTWAKRKAVDQAYCLYIIRCREAKAELRRVHDLQKRLCVYTTGFLKASEKAWKNYKPTWTHFKFIERIAEWKVVQGYCYKLPPAKHLKDATRICDEAQPLRSRDQAPDDAKQGVKRVRAGVYKSVETLPASRLT
eukprot:5469043-Prymnesium_polylepis.1